MEEECGSVAVEPLALSGDREVLTGESGREDGSSGYSSSCSAVIGGELRYVVVDHCVGEVAGEDRAGVLVVLALERCLRAGQLEAAVDAADP